MRSGGSPLYAIHTSNRNCIELYVHDDLKLHAWQHVHGLGAELRCTSEGVS